MLRFKKILSLPVEFPLARGMISYGIIWPTASIVQGYFEQDNSIRDYQPNRSRAARFSIFGAFFMAPVWHFWMRYLNRFFMKRDLKTALKRSIFEGVTFSPLSTAYFFFGVTALELKPLADCTKEVREKFWPTYKVGFVFWPTVQTLNFYLVPEKHRLVYLSFASFLFTMFLAYMKDFKQRKLNSK